MGIMTLVAAVWLFCGLAYDYSERKWSSGSRGWSNWLNLLVGYCGLLIPFAESCNCLRVWAVFWVVTLADLTMEVVLALEAVFQGRSLADTLATITSD